ncbi:MAG: flagellin, partial [Lachnospiraceae bacterium]|nr:flagellin [Lachnospiraceae bacterium]
GLTQTSTTRSLTASAGSTTSEDNTSNIGQALDVTTQASASIAIEAFTNALQMVSNERANLGAVQNRLEYSINNLDTSAENLQAAESRIRDVDMAEEMSEYSKYNILMQAGQSMLAQSNQMTQGVLSLLQ